MKKLLFIFAFISFGVFGQEMLDCNGQIPPGYCGPCKSVKKRGDDSYTMEGELYNGAFIKIIGYNQDSIIVLHGEMSKDQTSGYTKKFYLSGELLSHEVMTNGNRDIKKYYKNGQLKQTGLITELGKSGEWITYNEDGTIKDKQEYSDAKIIEEEGMPQMVTPSYRGGKSAMERFIAENLTYPQDCIEENIQGTVYLSFIVEKNGTLSEIKVDKGVHELLDAEAIRIVKKMPPWRPGTMQGYSIRGQYQLPIAFNLN